MPYRYLEDIATGDAAFEAEGRTLEELFREAADVMQKKRIHRLLVIGRDLSEPQKPAGIVSASDIVKEIGKG